MLKQSNNRKEQESKKLAADVEAFLASGGRITVVTAGRAGAMYSYNEAGVGEEVTVHRSLCHFTE